ncbi:hypothetical protein MHW47_19310 [Streptomyces sp. OfavH-34-F]|uniref:hypothetical protein n=1 Tax=Streptomyces sp. OfavH-34-F TaxID=2917760 RepID=UPI001EF3BD83|nr:hypothetical protein [Streptomyces sp. OfavH-34-F]MCG7526588.1 hypothetical protein [Streptomyces sp. OfavH-34-F]
MTKNTVWDTRRPWGTWQPERKASGPPPVWSGQSIVAGAAALFMGGVLAFEVYGLAEVTREAPEQALGPERAVLALPFMACFGVPFALVGSLLVVLPVVWAARRASDRTTGRDTWWWAPAVAVLPALLATAVAGIALRPGPGTLALVGLTAYALLAGSALLARDAALHGGRLLRVLGYGAAAAVAVFGLGAAAFGTGLLTEYRPPEMTAAQLTGTWGDGHGGTLRLSADGTARAERLTEHHSAPRDGADTAAARRCTGTGRWTYEPGDATSWDQRVELTLSGCGSDATEWSVGGTPDRPKLLQRYGDVDEPDWYTLTR